MINNFLPERLGVVGHYLVKHIRNGEVIYEENGTNLITDEGKNFILDTMFHGTTASGTWYFGLIDNSGYTGVVATDTHASHAGWTESTAYSETTRVEWLENAASSGSIGTSATKPSFSINATASIRGVFLADTNVKGSVSSSNKIWAEILFSSVLSVLSGDTIEFTYTVNMT